MIRTRLTERFDLKHPIVCAPMALTTGGKLAAAVTNAGGLGILGAGYCGVMGDEPDLEAEHRAAGNARIGIGVITWAAARRPQVVDWALAHQPACLFLSFGDPRPFAAKARDAGVPVFCQVQTLRHVEEAIDAGASVVVAQGSEAGGHGVKRATLTFVPEAADLLARRAPDVLLVAAGGIADGRGLAASLMLGADGILMGSRFWASDEALTPDAAVDRAIAATGDDTVRTFSLDAVRDLVWPDEFSSRVLRNRLADEWAHRESEARRTQGSYKADYETARRAGDLDGIAIPLGEATGLIRSRKSAAAIVEDTVSEAEVLLRGWHGRIEAG